jgi:hypothetical protein
MKVFDNGRPKYGKLLERVLDSLDVKRILTLLYNIDKTGYVQIDVWTFHHGAYSFSYNYGNLDFCQDDWDKKTEEEIMVQMIESAKRFCTLRQYHVWRAIQLLEK